MPERIDLRQVDDLRDVVHRAVACLAQGGVVGLPTESGYALVGGAVVPSAISRIQTWKGSPNPMSGRLPTLLLRGVAEVDDWALVATPSGRKLSRRAWPGPVTLVFPVAPGGLAHRLPAETESFLVDRSKIALRIPSHRTIREVLRLIPIPLILLEPPISTRGRPTSGDELEKLGDLDMILDVGPPSQASVSTIVELSPEGHRITRPGLMSAPLVDQLSGTILLFVCTGNTCRSPMAEALCKVLLARRLGCAESQLVEHGYVVLSAGVSAIEGMPAASNAVEVIRSRGGSLEAHLSQRVAPEFVRHADHIVAMTSDHLEMLLDRVPQIADRARLLNPSGDDIEDPVGSDLANYERTAREIEIHLDRLLDDLGL